MKRYIAIMAATLAAANLSAQHMNIATSGDTIGSIWGAMGYTVLLCFMLFKTGSISRSIFGAH